MSTKKNEETARNVMLCLQFWQHPKSWENLQWSLLLKKMVKVTMYNFRNVVIRCWIWKSVKVVHCILALVVTVSKDINVAKFIPWKSRSRSLSTTLAIVYFGKYQNVKHRLIHFWAGSHRSKILTFLMFYLEKIGQGHTVQFSQWRISNSIKIG